MSSPIYADSLTPLESGMMFQVDIIPSVPEYTGVSAEECIALADQELRQELKADYPGIVGTYHETQRISRKLLEHPTISRCSTFIKHSRLFASILFSEESSITNQKSR